ncbi:MULTISPECIES: succinate dehydrogenase assembly factor 2 [unclassified Devosia]|jgi:antitoxin CptB|uniref:FAD assembly factor SdhE n=1 Tax=unclassified Devosia TaxID=196773 RepID=UPI00155390C2|nr:MULTISPECIES: succinate dehydrogenase assembly factor 2 [unclassified Devosia]
MTAGEDISMRRKKIRYRAWHRGTREMDLVLGPFADRHVDTLSAEDLDRFEALLDEEDPPLLKWVLDQEAPPAGVDLDFLGRVIADHRSRMAK